MEIPNSTKIDPNWRKNPKFLSIQRISLENCLNKTGQIEVGEPLNKKKKEGAIVGFGKFRDLTYQELKTQQPGYYFWACKNIDGFQEKAEKFLK